MTSAAAKLSRLLLDAVASSAAETLTSRRTVSSHKRRTAAASSARYANALAAGDADLSTAVESARFSGPGFLAKLGVSASTVRAWRYTKKAASCGRGELCEPTAGAGVEATAAAAAAAVSSTTNSAGGTAANTALVPSATAGASSGSTYAQVIGK